MALTLELFASESHYEQDTTVSRRGDAEMQGFSTKLGPLMTKTCRKGERMQLVSDITAVLPVRC